MTAIAACPACTGAIPVAECATQGAPGDEHGLSLPGVHCAACIAQVEATLHTTPGIRVARVNLSRRRVRVVVAPGAGSEAALAALAVAGFEAHELDPDALTTVDDPAGRLLLAQIAVAGFAMMNVIALSVAVWSGTIEATRALFHWVSSGIALPAPAFSALPFFVSAWGTLRRAACDTDR